MYLSIAALSCILYTKAYPKSLDKKCRQTINFQRVQNNSAISLFALTKANKLI